MVQRYFNTCALRLKQRKRAPVIFNVSFLLIHKGNSAFLPHPSSKSMLGYKRDTGSNPAKGHFFFLIKDYQDW